jgi:hypothetical protein
MKIYLDVCCLNRPFDDQTQNRIRLEAEAVLLILGQIQSGDWTWCSSEVVDDEITQTPDRKRRERLEQLVIHAHKSYAISEEDIARAKWLVRLGFSGMDALHLASAESKAVDIFLTTDDKLLKRAVKLAGQLQITVENPLSWIVQQQEGDS